MLKKILFSLIAISISTCVPAQNIETPSSSTKDEIIDSYDDDDDVVEDEEEIVEEQIPLRRGKPLGIKKAAMWRAMMARKRREADESEYELREEEENHEDLILNGDYIETENEMTFLNDTSEEKPKQSKKQPPAPPAPAIAVAVADAVGDDDDGNDRNKMVENEPKKTRRRRRTKSTKTNQQDEDRHVESAPKRVRTRSKPSTKATIRKGTKPPTTRRARSRFNLESDFTNSFGASITQNEDLAPKEVAAATGSNTIDSAGVNNGENNATSTTNNADGTKPKRRARVKRISDGKKWLDYLTRLDEEKERKQRESELEYIRKSKLRQERYREQQLKYAKANSKAKGQ